jgi:hypothetical protein
VNDYPKDVRVISDVDYYDRPGGEGQVIGMLEKDRIVAIWECREDNWCPISGGWVWGDFLDR